MNKTNTTKLSIDKLETLVDELLHLVQQLKEENNGLRSKHLTLSQERSHLLEKNEIAKSRVEAIISRLKSLETNE